MKNTPTDPVPLLQALIRCPSVTPAEGGALSHLESVLKPLGFACHRLKFSDRDTPDVDNLYAELGGGGRHFCFAGHTDVVPEGNAADWSFPPFDGTVADGFVHGRGAADMKGSIAAFVAALTDYLSVHGTPKGKISLLITGDEEGPAINGTAKVLTWMKDKGRLPNHCLVGEPSCTDRVGDAMKIGRRGSLSFIVTVTGRQGHAAYPHKADNPIPKLARLVERLSVLEIDRGNAHFDPSTLAITSLDVGNPAGNVIPQRAVLKFNIRYSTEHDFASLRALVAREVAAVKEAMGGTWETETVEGAEAFITRPGPFVSLVAAAVEHETGVAPRLSTSGGTSDARFVKDYCEVVEFGPTNATIHQTDERLGVDDLRLTARVYRRILDDYFSN
jgi:succinyl-diaminopimelate desuccinylase